MGKHKKKFFCEKVKQAILSLAVFAINNVFEISRETELWLL